MQTVFSELVERSVGFSFPDSLYKRAFITLKRLHEKVRMSKRKGQKDVDPEVWTRVLYDQNMADCSLVQNLSDGEPEETQDTEGSEKVSAKRPKHCNLGVSSKQQKRRLDQVYSTFCVTAESEGISPVQLAGLFISRHSWMADRTMAELGEKLAHKKQLQPSKISTEAAALIMADAEIGKSADCKIASILKKEECDILPAYSEVNKFHKKITPEVKVLPQPHTGIEFPLYPAVRERSHMT